MLIGNFYEEAEHRLTTSQGEQLLGLGSRFQGEAAAAAVQKPEVSSDFRKVASCSK